MRTPTIAAVLATVALVAACGDDGADPAPAADRAPATSTKSKAVRFAECMRSSGIDGFPDPDADGELTVDGVLNGSGLDPSDPAWKQALEACRDLQPAGFTGRRRTPEQESEGRRFARCVREQGVADFPDPTPGEPLIDTNRIPSTATPAGMDALDAAIAACRRFGPRQ